MKEVWQNFICSGATIRLMHYSLSFAFIESDAMSSDESVCDIHEEMGLTNRKVGDYRPLHVDILSVRLPILDYFHCKDLT